MARKNKCYRSLCALTMTVLAIAWAPKTAEASPLALRYLITDLGSGIYRYRYDFTLELDNHDASWVPGHGWSWIIFGDSAVPPSPLASWSNSSVDPPFTNIVSTSGLHNGPSLWPPSVYFVPTAVGDTLMWSITATVDLSPGQVLFSTLNTVGGAVAADFEVASEILCGNSVLDGGEQCDDGNMANGDCCDEDCQYEASGSACPADGDACTDDVCDGAGGCGAQIDCDDGNACSQDSCDSGIGCVNDFIPASSCKVPGKSILLLKNNATDNSKDKLTFKWLKGAETALGELGRPTGTTGYTLCLYAGTASAAIAIPSGADWKPTGTKGFNYKEATGTGAPNGAQKVIMKSGAAGKSKVIVKGKGNDLPDSVVPALPLPVTAQLVNDANSTCFEAVYDSADVIKNDAKQFKAKAQ